LKQLRRDYFVNNKSHEIIVVRNKGEQQAMESKAVKTCKVEGCEKEIFSRALCQMHYKRLWRTGTTEILAKPEVKCTKCGERAYNLKRALCLPHYNYWYNYERLGRKPQPRRKPLWEVVGYRAAHVRVEKARGKARLYFCVDCSERAQEWSLGKDAENVLISSADNSAGKAYSLDVEDYEPRCMSCHRKHDGIMPNKVVSK